MFENENIIYANHLIDVLLKKKIDKDIKQILLILKRYINNAETKTGHCYCEEFIISMYKCFSSSCFTSLERERIEQFRLKLEIKSIERALKK